MRDNPVFVPIPDAGGIRLSCVVLVGDFGGIWLSCPNTWSPFFPVMCLPGGSDRAHLSMGFSHSSESDVELDFFLGLPGMPLLACSFGLKEDANLLGFVVFLPADGMPLLPGLFVAIPVANFGRMSALPVRVTDGFSHGCVVLPPGDEVRLLVLRYSVTVAWRRLPIIDWKLRPGDAVPLSFTLSLLAVFAGFTVMFDLTDVTGLSLETRW